MKPTNTRNNYNNMEGTTIHVYSSTPTIQIHAMQSGLSNYLNSMA